MKTETQKALAIAFLAIGVLANSLMVVHFSLVWSDLERRVAALEFRVASIPANQTQSPQPQQSPQ